MTENNYNKLIDAICELVNLAWDSTSKEEFERLDNAGADIIDCLEKLQQFEEIGTIDEFKQAKEIEAVYGQVKWERDIAISQLEEIGVALGQKMEEFKALKERSVGKKQGNINDFDSHLKLSKAGFLCCSSTNKDIRYPLISLSDLDYCPRCGQKLDWQ